MAEKILIIEDDEDMIQLLKLNLCDLGLTVDSATDGEQGLTKALAGDYALLILDLKLPRLNGLEICKRVRKERDDMMIFMLTTKTEEIDRVLGLELGADDYIGKPFSVREFVARVKALLRRPTARGAGAVAVTRKARFAELEIDLDRRCVTLAGVAIELTATEYDLLAFLATQPGRPISREQLITEVWGYSASGYEHTVNTHINRLRGKIEPDPDNPTYIKTVRGVGYRFVELHELADNEALRS